MEAPSPPLEATVPGGSCSRWVAGARRLPRLAVRGPHFFLYSPISLANNLGAEERLTPGVLPSHSLDALGYLHTEYASAEAVFLPTLGAAPEDASAVPSPSPEDPSPERRSGLPRASGVQGKEATAEGGGAHHQGAAVLECLPGSVEPLNSPLGTALLIRKASRPACVGQADG